jgi:hypothetical protein
MMSDYRVAVLLLEQYWLTYAFGVPVWGADASEALRTRYRLTVELCALLGLVVA